MLHQSTIKILIRAIKIDLHFCIGGINDPLILLAEEESDVSTDSKQPWIQVKPKEFVFKKNIK